jgi:tetratricopeptide (TPR) repeat protein
MEREAMSTLDEHARAGIEAINDQRFEDAIRELGAALAFGPDRPDLNNALGMAHMHRGDVGNGVEHLARAVELAAPFMDADQQEMKRHFHMGLATAYQLMDRVNDAVRVLQEAANLWPDQPEPQLQLAQLLVASGEPERGCAVYAAAASQLDEEKQEAAMALVGAVEAFLETEHDANVFLEAHRDGYTSYFNQVVATQVQEGWYCEAARMGRDSAGELAPIVAKGARPYALTRVDLVNPVDGTVAGIHSETEPMIVAVDGLEPLAQIPVLLPWRGYPFAIWVSTRSPWHWLHITVCFEDGGATEDEVIDRVDELIGSWYLDGFNGVYGDKEVGRFHYVTDPEVIASRAVCYVVDLGRSEYNAVEALVRKLAVLHDTHPIDRVLFGEGKLVV